MSILFRARRKRQRLKSNRQISFTPERFEGDAAVHDDANGGANEKFSRRLKEKSTGKIWQIEIVQNNDARMRA